VAVFFVLGTGRCGTVTLFRLLGSVPDCECLHEGRNWGKGIALAPLTVEFPHACAQQGSVPALRELFGNERIDHIRDCLARGEHFGESNHYAYPFIEFLQEEYPEAKFIHLIRNGYETVISWEARKRGIYPKDGTPGNQWAVAKPEPSAGDPWHEAWQSFKRRQKIIWYWAHANDFIDKKLRALDPSRRMLVRLEDLDEDKMNEIVDFLGLPRSWDRELLGPHNESRKSLRRGWTSRHLRHFREIAGEVADRFGYEVFDRESEIAAALAAANDDMSPFLARSVAAK
jgi:hypothetical protein